jgi:response regulator RpfG family c-di-GMP phosphodiesterase
MTAPRILLVDGDGARRGALAFDLESRHGLQVTPLGDAASIVPAMSAAVVQALVTRAALPDGDVIGLLGHLARQQEVDTATIVLVEPNEHGLRRLAFLAGADVVLTLPVDASDLAAVVQSVLGHRHARREAEQSRERLAASMDRLTDLLVLIMDAAVPGSAHRGATLAGLSTRLAAQFELAPVLLEDLVRAARLHEVGRFTLGDAGIYDPGRSSAGHCTMASALLLADVPYLQEAADVIEGIGANWDGTGIPAGRQRGQIPLRSRLLRVGADLLAASERLAREGEASLQAALETLQPHAGSWYDPAVLAALHQTLSDERQAEWQDGVLLLSPDRLTAGMRLADDLQTASGVKLLSTGAILTPAMLQLVRRRHDIDPLALPIAIHRREH